MVRKEFTFKGKTLEELKRLSLKEFAELLGARQRRSINRGLSDQKRDLIENVKKNKTLIETHCRDAIVVPDMINKRIKVHNGRNFVDVVIQPEMLGHYLGEFVLTRKRVTHHAPGIGATRSSASLSVK
jgi:small subunit ribosomal protein S19